MGQCCYPVKMFRATAHRHYLSNKLLVFSHEKKAFLKCGHGNYREFFRACGSCVDCRLTKSRYVAMRCVHETLYHDDNQFLTLTYSDENLPDRSSLCTDHLQDFWKRYRQHLARKKGPLIKYYAAGEYGDGQGSRGGWNPHYHACVFGHWFPDAKFFKTTSSGSKIYTSDRLSQLWPYGFATIGFVSFESAAYVARYVMKKVTGRSADAYYDGRERERSYSSQGIGKQFCLDNMQSIYDYDEVCIRSRLMRPPPYYDQLLLKHDPALFMDIEARRAGNKLIDKNNYALTFDPLTRTHRTVSDVVHTAQIKAGNLDYERY